jgi:arylsulfatase A-like enzyme
MLHPERGQPNLLKLLKENGYTVWWGGKNDLVPGQDGHEAHCTVKFLPTQDDYRRWGHEPKPGLHSWTPWRGEPGSDTYYGFLAGKLPTGEDDIYCDGDWADVLGAVDFIRSYEGDEPLCIYLPLLYPHPPYGVEEPFYSSADRSQMPPRVPAPSDWEAAGKPSILAGIHERQGIAGWPEERFEELRAVYYGMCNRIDHQLGLVLNALRDRGFYDDTALFFFSDHGDFTGDYGLVEKTQNTFEDVLTRVPLVVKLPADAAGDAPRSGVADTLAELVDIPATIYELAGIEPGYWHFGKSLLPVLQGQTATHRDEVHCEGGRLRGETAAMELDSLNSQPKPEESQYFPRVGLQVSDEGDWHTKASMVRTHRYKYVRRLYEPDELYNLETDPGEERNLIQDPSMSAVLNEMQLRLLTWYQETADVVPFETDRRNF